MKATSRKSARTAQLWPSPRPASGDRWRPIAVCAGLLLLIAAAYWPVARNDFIGYDDSDYVVENEFINGGLAPHNIYVAFTQSHSANWHPLTWISHMLDCQLLGLRPAGHHAMSLAFHAVNSILLYLVLLRMTGANWPSAAVAALFAVHPLHVESVAWIAERKDVLSTLFGLAALWAWLGYVARPGWGRYLAVVLWYAASLMSKSMLVTLPCLLLLLDWWPLDRVRAAGGKGEGERSRKGEGEKGKRGEGEIGSSPFLPVSPSPVLRRVSPGTLVLEKLPLALMAAASCCITMLAQSSGHAVASLGRLSFAARLAVAAQAYCGYLGKMIYPLRLAPFYPLPKEIDYPAAGVCAALLAVATVLLFLGARRRKYLAVGWLWYLGLLAPVIGVVQVGQQSMADRYTYLPAVGIFMLLAWPAADVLARRPSLKPPLAALVAAALGACCVLSNGQSRLWASTKALFTHTVAVTERNSVALTNLGLVAIQEDRLEDAERYLREALQLEPTEIDAWGNLANVYRKQKKYNDALKAYAKIDQYCPGNPKCLNVIADTFEEMGNHAAAEEYLTKALKAEPASTLYRAHLAVVLQAEGKTAEALKLYLDVVRDHPGDSMMRNNAAWILATNGDARLRDGAKAVELLLPAVKDPQCEPNLLDTLAAAYAEAGQFDRAIETAQRAIGKAREEAAPPGALAEMEKRLSLYKNRRPYHEAK